MNSIKFLALALAIGMLLAILTGCGAGDPAAGKTPEESRPLGTETDNGGSGGTEENPSAVVTLPSDELRYTEMPESLSVRKLMSVAATSVDITEGGIYYRGENGLFGVMDLDGTSDSGPVYEYCTREGAYFAVCFDRPDEITQIADLNCIGLISADGKELIPQKYAAISVLNERFAKVSEVDHLVEARNEALVFYSDRQFAFSPDEGDTLFGGNWYIYDLATGKKVPGAAGTAAYSCTANGNYVTYVSDDKEYVTVNAEGELLNENASKVIGDLGLYTVKSDGKGALYDSSDNLLFAYDPEGFVPAYENGTYIVAKRYENGEYTCVVMDLKGNTVSTEFTYSGMGGFQNVYGRLIHFEDKLYDFQGNLVSGDGAYSGVRYDKRFENVWLAYSNDAYVMIYADGTVLSSGALDGTVQFDSSYMHLYTKAEQGNDYFCLKTGDFTVNGYALAPWLVEKSEYVSGVKNVTVIETVSGQVLLSGYESMSYAYAYEDAFLIYGKNAEGTYDVFAVE